MNAYYLEIRGYIRIKDEVELLRRFKEIGVDIYGFKVELQGAVPNSPPLSMPELADGEAK